VEVLATVELLLGRVAFRGIVELIVASNWEEPEYEKMTNDKNSPVHYEFGLLLIGNFGLTLIET